jgi:hypothetical protein
LALLPCTQLPSQSKLTQQPAGDEAGAGLTSRAQSPHRDAATHNFSRVKRTLGKNQIAATMANPDLPRSHHIKRAKRLLNIGVRGLLIGKGKHMKQIIRSVACLAACALTACTPSAGGDDAVTPGVHPNLACAATISAATYVIKNGEAPRDKELMGRALFSMMHYLNSYAIPRGMKEHEAFAELHKVRIDLMDALPADRIISRAKTCASRQPA